MWPRDYTLRIRCTPDLSVKLCVKKCVLNTQNYDFPVYSINNPLIEWEGNTTLFIQGLYNIGN